MEKLINFKEGELQVSSPQEEWKNSKNILRRRFKTISPKKFLLEEGFYHKTNNNRKMYKNGEKVNYVRNKTRWI